MNLHFWPFTAYKLSENETIAEILDKIFLFCIFGMIVSIACALSTSIPVSIAELVTHILAVTSLFIAYGSWYFANALHYRDQFLEKSRGTLAQWIGIGSAVGAVVFEIIDLIITLT